MGGHSSMDFAGVRKAVRVVATLAALVWALNEMTGRAAGDDAALAAQEKFVPGTERFLKGATLELRAEASVAGAEVTLKQVCRWADSDQPAFEPIADLVIARMGTTHFRAVTLKELKSLLHDAGVNLAVIRFAGQTRCEVSRTDLPPGPESSLDAFLKTREPSERAEAATARATPATLPAAIPVHFPASQPAKAREGKESKTLRELLVADLLERLSLDPKFELQMKFNPGDDKVLALSEPLIRFHIDGQRVRGLGEVSWEVTLLSGEAKQKVTIDALARAWVHQVETVKPIGYHQTIQPDDVEVRRSLIDRLSGDAILTREQVVGQWASMQINTGVQITPRHIEAVPLVRVGQSVTVTAEQGTVRVKSAAVAVEGGTFGQTIRLKTEGGETFQATITGVQTAKVSGIGTTSDVAALGN